ncbi:MAG: hypothetical protein R3C02_05550 [Planctomycetaceae bacterium]
MKIEGRGLIYDANDRPVNERVAAFVSLCRLSSGSLICGFQLGPKKHAVNSTIRFCRSDDDGNTWQESSVRFRSCVSVPGSLSSGEIVGWLPVICCCMQPGSIAAILTGRCSIRRLKASSAVSS